MSLHLRLRINSAAIVIAALILSQGCSHTYQEKDLAPFIPELYPDTQEQFENEKKAILNQAQNANFTKLRLSYTGTDKYKPWDTTEHEAALTLLNAQEDLRYELCLSIANAILSNNYTSLDGHYGAYICNAELGNHELAKFHNDVLKGLIDSIKSSGDGKNIETAYKTISTIETRAFIRLMGLLMYRQENILAGHKHIDLIYTHRPATNEDIPLYFDSTVARMSSFKIPKPPKLQGLDISR